MSKHAVVHIEIAAKDPKATGDFYASLFDWKVTSDPNMDYVMFDNEPGQGGGFPKIDNKMYKPGDVVVYIDTDDIEATLKKIVSLGGKVVAPKTEIPGMGWFAFFADPNGNRLGLFTPMSMPA
jgi:predicted enzyme related to lactoylglutathione lyase